MLSGTLATLDTRTPLFLPLVPFGLRSHHPRSEGSCSHSADEPPARLTSAEEAAAASTRHASARGKGGELDFFPRNMVDGNPAGKTVTMDCCYQDPDLVSGLRAACGFGFMFQ